MPKAEIEIIYADDSILVINKPSGVSVTRDRSGEVELVHMLAKQLGPQICSTLRLVHRLDKHTSGVMLLAKNAEAQTELSSYFGRKLIKKTYLALVTGPVHGREGTIDEPLANSSKKPGTMCIDRKRGKEALTKWKLLADFGPISLLAVYPLTGRTHQIRVHLHAVGLPLLIDPLYGNPKPFYLSTFKTDYRLGKGQTERPLIDRLTLHAYQLSIANRKSKIANEFVACLDKKFAATIKMLAKHNTKQLDAFVNPDDFSKIMNGQELS